MEALLSLLWPTAMNMMEGPSKDGTLAYRSYGPETQGGAQDAENAIDIQNTF